MDHNVEVTPIVLKLKVMVVGEICGFAGFSLNHNKNAKYFINLGQMYGVVN